MVIDLAGEVQVITDDRNIRIPDLLPETIEALRNQPNGYWVASTNPDAAHHAVTGSFDLKCVRSAALLTDGASRWVDRFKFGTWGDLLAALSGPDGPKSVVSDVRRAEVDGTAHVPAPAGHNKPSDDATALFLTPVGS